jgi:hypothetical protein
MSDTRLGTQPIGMVYCWVIGCTIEPTSIAETRRQMTENRYQLTNLWKRTLAPQGKKDEHASIRERLRSEFVKFRGRAAQLGNEIPQDLPFFTVHDVSHLDALWEMIDLVAGPDYPLTPTEAFILGGAMLIHDLAMSQAAFQHELGQLKTEPLWQDTVASLLRPQLNRPATVDEIASPDEKIERAAIQTLLRELHARQASVLPTKEWGYAGTTYYLLDDADLRSAFADDIGKVAFSHHWPIDDLLDLGKLQQNKSCGPGLLPREWTVDLVKLACLLRTADAAQADDRRAPGFLAALRQPAGTSDQHWRFQHLLRVPHREANDDRIRYRSSRPFQLDEIDSWWVAYDWLGMVDRELQATDSLLASTSRQRLAAKGVWNANHPARLAEDLQTNGWEPANVQLRISDVAGLVRKLGGSQLYGQRPDVPLRELIQNAADGIRARRRLQKRDHLFGRIVVRPGRDADASQDWIEVEDNGVGMSKGVLTGPLLDFGAAFWGTGRMRQEYPGLEAAGMEATGQFGIGFFSLFMWGERVRVITRRYDHGYDNTWVLEFRRGVGHRPWLRKGILNEQQSLPDGGTRVRVWCDPGREIPTAILRRESPSTASCTWFELCEWLAPALDVDLSVEVDGEVRTVIRANDWLSIDARTMLLRINRKSSDQALTALMQREDQLSSITPYLRMVRDESGTPVARGTVWSPDPDYFRNSVTVCGGLRTDGGGNFLGLRFGKPDTAARHLAVDSEHLPGWTAWAEEQLGFDDQNRFHVMLRAIAAIRIAAFINPGNMPIGCSHSGWVTLDQFAEAIQHAPCFQCVGAPLWAAAQLLRLSPGIPCLILHGHHMLNQIDGRSFTITRLLRETAARRWGVPCEMSDLNRGMQTLHINGRPVMYHVITFRRGRSSES